MKNNTEFTKMVTIVVVILFGIWIWNAVKFVSCDFESDFKCEVIHGAGVFIPGAAVITVWFDTDD
jgi:hypothetical protein